ncbi:MAG: integrase arm-type DNA-binding domain-containing protein [Alphaproteobacteria bacterium]|nr:integrase arm-type DNA-binding domain-containing protein [Alphaproteobacteria bacterium]
MGARHLLTDKQIDKARNAPAGARYILWDGVVPSLGLRVTDKGHKSFLVQRRVNGRMIKLTLGEYPAVGLADARERAQAALKDMARGIDPRQGKPAQVTASGLRKDSFEGAVETYIKREVEKNRRPRTQVEIIRPLRKLFVRWGTLPLSAIGPREILDLLDEIGDAGTPVAANRTYSVLRRFFRWCVERQLLPTNPAANVRKPSKEQSRSRVLDDNELREVWNACADFGWPFGPYFRALILTGQHRSELAGMTWGEVNLDERQWMVPAARTKNGHEHLVPLSKPMMEIFAKAPQFADDDAPDDLRARPIFTTNGETGVSGFSRAKARLEADMLKARIDLATASGTATSKVKPMPAWTLHDLRRSCATGMARIGVAPHIIETVLNHMSGFRSGIAGVYQRHPYVEERRRALEAWAQHLQSFVDPAEPGANVVSLRGAKR